ncbi:hypothetical protein BH11PLA1_BH11PLA1_16280 [soil metagenome]
MMLGFPLTLGLVSWVGVLFILFLASCLLLMLTVLIQKPQGGGLAGAFGSGAGSGQTAFGTRTGDALTVATISMFVLYLVTAVGLNYAARPDGPILRKSDAATSTEKPATTAPATTAPATPPAGNVGIEKVTPAPVSAPAGAPVVTPPAPAATSAAPAPTPASTTPPANPTIPPTIPPAPTTPPGTATPETPR